MVNFLKARTMLFEVKKKFTYSTKIYETSTTGSALQQVSWGVQELTNADMNYALQELNLHSSREPLYT